jgi:hypothetical protein
MAEEKTAPSNADIEAQAALLKSGATAKPTGEKKDPASPADTGKAEKTEKAEVSPATARDPAVLQAQIDGLTKELARIRKDNRASVAGTAEADTLREQLAGLRGQIEVLTKQKGAEKETFTDEQLLTYETYWEKQLAKAAASGDAQAEGDAEAKVNWIRGELHKRAKAAVSAEADAKAEQAAVQREAVELLEEGVTLFPELADKESALWKAANTEYQRRPKLMKVLGPYADMIAVSMALAKNPKLMGQEASQARQAFAKEIQQTAETALLKGAGTAETKTTPNYDTMGRDDIEALAAKMKGLSYTR